MKLGNMASGCGRYTPIRPGSYVLRRHVPLYRLGPVPVGPLLHATVAKTLQLDQREAIAAAAGYSLTYWIALLRHETGTRPNL